MSKLHATGDRLLVQRIDVKRQTTSGIILPDSTTEKPVEGTILNVGEEVEKTFLPGQHILFSKYGGVELSFENEDYVFLRQTDVLARIESDD